MAKYRRETYQNPDQPAKRGHKGCLVVIVLVIVLLAVAAFGAFSVMQDVNGRDKLGDEVLVTVQQGENSASIARSLKDAGSSNIPTSSATTLSTPARAPICSMAILPWFRARATIPSSRP